MTENQRSILWATMPTTLLHEELRRLTHRVSEAIEAGRPFDAQTWRTWTEEILLELEMRDEDPGAVPLRSA